MRHFTLLHILMHQVTNNKLGDGIPYLVPLFLQPLKGNGLHEYANNRLRGSTRDIIIIKNGENLLQKVVHYMQFIALES